MMGGGRSSKLSPLACSLRTLNTTTGTNMVECIHCSMLFFPSFKRIRFPNRFHSGLAHVLAYPKLNESTVENTERMIREPASDRSTGSKFQKWLECLRYRALNKTFSHWHFQLLNKLWLHVWMGWVSHVHTCCLVQTLVCDALHRAHLPGAIFFPPQFESPLEAQK